MSEVRPYEGQMYAARSYRDPGYTRRFRPAARLIVLNEVGQKGGLSPEELVSLIDAVAREQDRNAFARLFSYFAPRLKSFLLRSGLSDAAAEDLVQDVMVTVWRKASYFNAAHAGVSTWVFTIARNRRIDRLRRARSGPADPLADPSDDPDLPRSGEDIVIAAEREREVRTALGALPSDQAIVVRLSFFAEKPHAEIARELGIPLGTVKSRVRLAMDRLRILLDSDT